MIDPISALRTRLKGRTQTALADELGVSPAYLSDVLRGAKEPGKKILEPLGLYRVVTYRRRP